MEITTKKCMFCNGIYVRDCVKILNGWAYCPLCNKPLFDITIQDSDHWIFKFPKAKKYLRSATNDN